MNDETKNQCIHYNDASSDTPLNIITPELTDGIVRLAPAKKSDVNYLFSLVLSYKFNSTRPTEIFMLMKNISEAWVGYTDKNIRGGVIYLTHHMNDFYTLDAYRSPSLTGLSWSRRAGQLVIDYFFKSHTENSILTIHTEKNHAATKVCTQLGFKIKNELLGYVLMERKRKPEEQCYGCT